MVNKCAKCHKDSPSDKRWNSFSWARLNFWRRPFLCTTLYGNPMQASNFGGTFDQLFLWIFYKKFTEDSSLFLLYHGAKKLKKTENSNQGGPALIREVSLYEFQRETRCTGPRLGTRTVVIFWTTYANHAEIELSAWFETHCISVHFACFRGVSSPYIRSAYQPRYETMEIPRRGTETAADVSWFCWPVARPIFGNGTTYS